MAAASSAASSGSQGSGQAPVPSSRQSGGPQAPAKAKGATSASGPSSVPSTKGQRVTGDSILEAVDGEGQAPSLAKAEKPEPGKEQVQAKKKNGSDQRAQQANEVTAPSDHLDPESIFQKALEAHRPQKQAGDGQTDEGEPLSEREQNRIQSLVNQTRAAEQRAERSEMQMRELGSRFEQMQAGLGQHLMQMQEQNARLQGQLQAMLNGQRREQLDPVQQVEQDLIGKASTAAERKLMGHIQQLQQRLEGFEQRAQQQQRTAEINSNKQKYLGEATHHGRSVVLAGFPEEAQSRLMPLVQELVTAKAWGKRTDMASAAKMVREDFLQLGLEFVRAQARQNQQQREQTEGAHSAPPAQRSVAEGEPEPSYDELRAAGYRGMDPFMEWDMAGRPALRR